MYTIEDSFEKCSHSNLKLTAYMDSVGCSECGNNLTTLEVVKTIKDLKDTISKMRCCDNCLKKKHTTPHMLCAFTVDCLRNNYIKWELNTEFYPRLDN